MSLIPGIRAAVRLAADQAVASSIVPVTLTDFSFTLGINAVVLFDLYLPFTLGATGGFRFLLSQPAGGSCNLGYSFVNTVTPLADGDVVVAINTAYADASAVAGEYILSMRGTVINGTTNGLAAFQFAQNTSDVLPITALAGAWMQITRVN